MCIIPVVVDGRMLAVVRGRWRGWLLWWRPMRAGVVAGLLAWLTTEVSPRVQVDALDEVHGLLIGGGAGERRSLRLRSITSRVRPVKESHTVRPHPPSSQIHTPLIFKFATVTLFCSPLFQSITCRAIVSDATQNKIG